MVKLSNEKNLIVFVKLTNNLTSLENGMYQYVGQPTTINTVLVQAHIYACMGWRSTVHLYRDVGQPKLISLVNGM